MNTDLKTELSYCEWSTHPVHTEAIKNSLCTMKQAKLTWVLRGEGNHNWYYE